MKKTSYCTIKDRYLLSKPSSTRSTYHVVLNIKEDPLSFQVGDSIAITPENDPVAIEKILSILKVSKNKTIIEKKSKQTSKLYDYLLTKANICKVPTSLLRLIASKCNNLKLENLLMAENKKELSSYLEAFEVWDFLQEYQDVFLSPQELVDKLLPMMPRFYSIASSPLVIKNEIHLTVAHLSYNSLGHIRFGVGSNFLCKQATKQTKISYYIQPSHGFSLPEDTSKDIIMVGPGTGVAPFRGFIEERAHTNAKGLNWLFFGERNKDTDFYYKDFFTTYINKGLLTLDTAFSRDQKDKIYVQHLIEKHGSKIVSLIENSALFYVCGDAKKMAKDVDNVLHHIIKIHKNLTEDETVSYMKNLRKEKRYLTDVY